MGSGKFARSVCPIGFSPVTRYPTAELGDLCTCHAGLRRVDLSLVIRYVSFACCIALAFGIRHTARARSPSVARFDSFVVLFVRVSRLLDDSFLARFLAAAIHSDSLGTLQALFFGRPPSKRAA